MATRIELGQDIKLRDPFEQEAKKNTDILSKVGPKGEGYALPQDVLNEEGEGKGPVRDIGKAPRKKHPLFDEGGEVLASPFEHFID